MTASTSEGMVDFLAEDMAVTAVQTIATKRVKSERYNQLLSLCILLNNQYNNLIP